MRKHKFVFETMVSMVGMQVHTIFDKENAATQKRKKAQFHY